MILMQQEGYILSLWFSLTQMYKKWQQPFLVFLFLFILQSFNLSFFPAKERERERESLHRKRKKKRKIYMEIDFLAFCCKETWCGCFKHLWWWQWCCLYVFLFLFYSLLYCVLFSLSLDTHKIYVGVSFFTPPIHGGPGCQDLANKKNTSTIQLLEEFSWMTPEIETCNMKTLYYKFFERPNFI